jgi:hypothetical protein
MLGGNLLARKAIRDGSLAGATHIWGRNGAWIEEYPPGQKRYPGVG